MPKYELGTKLVFYQKTKMKLLIVNIFYVEMQNYRDRYLAACILIFFVYIILNRVTTFLSTKSITPDSNNLKSSDIVKKLSESHSRLRSDETTGWISVLDTQIWKSQAFVSSCIEENWNNERRASLCRFNDVFVDYQTFYFTPRPGREEKAAKDLISCCFQDNSNGGLQTYKELRGQCGSIKTALFCTCFSFQKYVPSVWIKGKMPLKGGPKEISGSTWVMNHWSEKHHIDHFQMKILEFLQYSKGNERCQKLVKKEDIDNFMGMDYPLHESWKVEMERFFLNKIIPRSSPLYTANPDGLYSFMPKHSDKLSSVCDIFQFFHECPKNKDRKNLRSVFHLNTATLSPMYKNQLPFPYEKSRNIILSTFGSIPKKEGRFKVAVLKRVEGVGLRRWTNEREVLQIIFEETKTSDLTIIAPSSKTPMVLQRELFSEFDLLITCHSSALSNLIFSKKSAKVIELQPDTGNDPETTFLLLGSKLGLNYELLQSGNTLAANSPGDYTADFTVHIGHLRSAIRRMLMNKP